MPASGFFIALAAAAICLGPVACLSLDPDAPLGSVENPVRAYRFSGELDYLSRLRCPDGSKPHAYGLQKRVRGPYGKLLDGYRVRCIYLNAESRIYIDPFHEGYVEQQAVAGFTSAPDRYADWLLRAPPEWRRGEHHGRLE